MNAEPRFGEMLLGIEGRAMLRLAFTGSPTACHARVEEIRSLVERFNETPELSVPRDGPEYDLMEGRRLWSETYDRPVRLFSVEEPVRQKLLDSFGSSVIFDAACGTQPGPD